MPEEQINALHHYQWYAKKSGNMAELIRGLELQVRSYIYWGDTANILSTIDKVHDLYIQNGQPEAANAAYSPKICIYINKGEYAKARMLMDIYEKESNLFDSSNNIESGREYYYVMKGDYYLSTGLVDSANIYFDKALAFSFNLDAYNGKMKACMHSGDIDSALMYLDKYIEELNKAYSWNHHEATLQAQGMYNYSRFQHIARKKSQEADTNRNIAIAIFLSALFAVVATIVSYWRYIKRKQHETAELSRKWYNATKSYEKTKNELNLLNNNYIELQKQKQQELLELEAEVNEHSERLNVLNKKERLDMIKSHPLMEQTKKWLKRPTTSESPLDEKGWDELDSVIATGLPEFYHFISNNSRLTRQEVQVAILVRLGFQSGEIGLLLGKSSQRIANAKSDINEKLFNNSSAKELQKSLSVM